MGIEGVRYMLFDLHIHQNLHSKDSRLAIETAVEEAKALGLSGIGITDHDDLGLRNHVDKLSKELNFLIIVGVEIYTLDGDLLCYGIDEMPSERLSAEDTIQYVHERGGICIAAHPYRHNNRGLGQLIESIDGLDAIEAFNGRTDHISNTKALDVAKLRNIPATGSSDAHQDGEVGTFVTAFEDSIYSERDLIKAIKSKKFKPEFIKTSKEQLA